MTPCPCGSSQCYDLCCEPYHRQATFPSTAEKLMRSRYTAFVRGEIEYLKKTLWPKFQREFDQEAYRHRAQESLWLGLHILKTKEGEVGDRKGEVEFIARTLVNGVKHEQRERSFFKKKAGRWYYVGPLN